MSKILSDMSNGYSSALTWSMHLIIFVNNAMRQAHGFLSPPVLMHGGLLRVNNMLLLLLIQNHVLTVTVDTKPCACLMALLT